MHKWYKARFGNIKEILVADTCIVKLYGINEVVSYFFFKKASLC
jgi:hypothetical protein